MTVLIRNKYSDCNLYYLPIILPNVAHQHSQFRLKKWAANRTRQGEVLSGYFMTQQQLLQKFMGVHAASPFVLPSLQKVEA